VKLLLFSDLHSDLGAARLLVAWARRADVVVAAGDFCNAHQRLPACLDVLRAIDRPTVLVAGNNETTEELIAGCRAWPHAHVLHGSGVALGGVEFFGLGGGVPVTPFGSWSYDFTEEQAAGLLAGCPAGCVLVSHSPPRGAVDVSSRGENLGSVSVRAAIQRVRPVLVVCGHIHASAGAQAFLGTTPVINAGPAGIEWELSAP
jgi:Icc-related predicted phosphoesterase